MPEEHGGLERNQETAPNTTVVQWTRIFRYERDDEGSIPSGGANGVYSVVALHGSL